MENNQGSYKRILRIVFYIVASAQIVMGLMWFLINAKETGFVKSSLFFILLLALAFFFIRVIGKGSWLKVLFRALYVTTIPVVLFSICFAIPKITPSCEKSPGFLLANHTLVGHLSEFGYYLGNDLVSVHGSELVHIDTNPDLMISELGNWIEEEYPDKAEREYHYYWLSKSAFAIWKKDLLIRNTAEILEYTFTPYAPMIIEKFSVRNTDLPMIKKQFTELAPGFSNFYYRFSFTGFLVLSILALFMDFKKNIKSLIPVLCISTLIALILWWISPRGFDFRRGLFITILYGLWFIKVLFMNEETLTPVSE